MNSVITYACVCVGMRVGFAVSRQTPEKDGYDVRWLLLVLPQFDPPLPLLLSPLLLPIPPSSTGSLARCVGEFDFAGFDPANITDPLLLISRPPPVPPAALGSWSSQLGR